MLPSPHVLRVRSGGCALVDFKLAAPMTPSDLLAMESFRSESLNVGLFSDAG
ncbi:hypothetical protein KCP78_00545 [Salmonella enterica subsp. enterica]|nr:hypothetical protein KCP78_00545 [Salmonella enterica subsp. enterica]